MKASLLTLNLNDIISKLDNYLKYFNKIQNRRKKNEKKAIENFNSIYGI